MNPAPEALNRPDPILGPQTRQPQSLLPGVKLGNLIHQELHVRGQSPDAVHSYGIVAVGAKVRHVGQILEVLESALHHDVRDVRRVGPVGLHRHQRRDKEDLPKPHGLLHLLRKNVEKDGHEACAISTSFLSALEPGDRNQMIRRCLSQYTEALMV